MSDIKSFPISIDFPAYQESRGGPFIRPSDERMVEIMRGVLAGYNSLSDEAKRRVRSIKIKVGTYGHEGKLPDPPEGGERFDYEARITYNSSESQYDDTKEKAFVAQDRLYYREVDPQEEICSIVANLVRSALQKMLEEYVRELQTALKSTRQALLP